MAHDFQVAVDCASPHQLAAWWADALGWLVEEQDKGFIHKMIAEGYATQNETTTHNGKLVWRDGASIRHPDGPESGPRKRILFQLVPEGKWTVSRSPQDTEAGERQLPPGAVKKDTSSGGAMTITPKTLA